MGAVDVGLVSSTVVCSGIWLCGTAVSWIA